MSAAQVEEQLRASYLNRHDIPNVHNIEAHIKIVLKERRAAIEADAATAASGSSQTVPATKKTRRCTMSAEYAETLECLAREQPQMKPGAVKDKLWTEMGITAENEPVDLPIEKQLK